MYHVSQVNTAFDDFFCRRLKLISRLGSQLWFVNIKIKNPRTGKYFIGADSQTSRYGIVKNVSLSIRLPSLQMEVSTTFDVFNCQEEIEFSKITVVRSAPFVLVAN